MKVLFVDPPESGFDKDLKPRRVFEIGRTPPIGAMSMASYLRENGHEVEILDGSREVIRFGNIRRLVYNEMLRRARKFKPDFIPITIWTNRFYEAEACIRMFRKAFPKALIVGGGAHPSGAPETTLKQLSGLDGIGIGPGEDTCLDLANEGVIGVDGTAYLLDDEFVHKKRVCNINIDKYPMLAYDLIDSDFYCQFSFKTGCYGLLKKSLPFMTSRGCIGDCTFCSSQWNKPFRRHSVDYIIDVCEHLVETYPIDHIVFWDDSIATNLVGLRKMCDEFEGGITEKITWNAMVRADQVNSDLCEMIIKGGCNRLGFGFESGNNRVLKEINKGTTVEINTKAADIILESELYLLMTFMIGIPSETEDEMMNTFNLIKKYANRTYIGFGRFCPLPGSSSYIKLVEEGKIDPNNVNWEELSVISNNIGPYFAAAPEERFNKLLPEIKSYIYRESKMKFFYENNSKYPEIVDLFKPKKRRLLSRLFK